ncbi:hypothetical protein LZ32DRAFT_621253, partial [Colletotrichum eremochloae]
LTKKANLVLFYLILFRLLVYLAIYLKYKKKISKEALEGLKKLIFKISKEEDSKILSIFSDINRKSALRHYTLYYKGFYSITPNALRALRATTTILVNVIAKELKGVAPIKLIKVTYFIKIFKKLRVKRKIVRLLGIRFLIILVVEVSKDLIEVEIATSLLSYFFFSLIPLLNSIKPVTYFYIIKYFLLYTYLPNPNVRLNTLVLINLILNFTLIKFTKANLVNTLLSLIISFFKYNFYYILKTYLLLFILINYNISIKIRGNYKELKGSSKATLLELTCYYYLAKYYYLPYLKLISISINIILFLNIINLISLSLYKLLIDLILIKLFNKSFPIISKYRISFKVFTLTNKLLYPFILYLKRAIAKAYIRKYKLG